MGASRNGTKKVEAGERGIASSEGDDGLFVYGKKKPASVRDLDYMLRVDGWASAIQSALTWPIRAPKWSVVEADGDRGEAALCREQLEPLMRRVVAGMCSAVGRRIAPAELVWAYQGGRAVLEDVAFRSVSTCEPERDKNNRIIGFVQRAHAKNRFVEETFLFEERKAFVYVHDSTTDPNAGSSAFETAWHDFEDKQKVRFYRGKNLEKFGGARTVVKTNEKGEAREALAKAGRDLRSAGSAVIGKEDELVDLAAPNAGVAFRQAINDLNFEMAVSALVQWLSYAQEGNSGSYNASEIQHRLMQNVAEGRIAEMEEAAGSLCRHICEVNFGPDAAVPTVEAEDIAEEPKERLRSAAEQHFARTGLPEWMKGPLEEAYGRSMGIEKPEDADEGEPEQTTAAEEAGEEEGSTP